MAAKICSKCGALIPLHAQLSIAQPWKWGALCSVLVGDIPKPQCQRCQHELILAAITVLPLPNPPRIFMVFSGSPDKKLVKKVKASLPLEIEKDLSLTILSNLEDLKSHIYQHVLVYKPLLKNLCKAQRDGKLSEFVLKHWQELTPLAMSAGLVGFTGLVPGIGGEAVDLEAGRKASLKEKLEAAQSFFAEVQLLVWLSILSTKMSSEFTLENALREHVLAGCIYGENLKILSSILESMRERAEISPLNWYACQTLYASIAFEENIQNCFGLEWAQAYFSFELALRKEESANSVLAAWRISAQRAASIIKEKDAWDVIAHQLSKNFTKDIIPSLNLIAERIGYKDLVGRVAASISLSSIGESPLEIICKFLDDSILKDMPGWPRSVLRVFSVTLFQTANVELVEKVFNYAFGLIKGNYDQQADIESWYGMCMKELRQPKRFIDLVGQQPRDWEFQLSLERRVDLWNERSNAFRLLGNYCHALALTETLLDLINSKDEFASQRFVLLRNRGILLRETGALDASRRQLKELTNNCLIEDRASLLESYAATCNAMGRYEETIDILLQALEFGKEIKHRLLLHLALAYTMSARNSDAIKELAKLQKDSLSGIEVALLIAIYLNLLFSGENLDEHGQQQLNQSSVHLEKLAKTMEADGDFQMLGQILTMQGHIAENFGMGNSEEIWLKLLSVSSVYKRYPSPVALAHLASLAYFRNNRDKALSLIRELPRALIDSYGAIDDLSIAFDSTRFIRPTLTGLMKAAIKAKAPWPDIRLIAELRRDTIGRARLMQVRKSNLINVDLLEAGISDETLTNLAPKHGQLGILEWIDDGPHLFAMLTIIDSQLVRPVILLPPEFDIFELRSCIMNRLSVWHAGRKGSPFDIPDWNILEQWLHTEIAQYFPEGGHIVLINHESLVGLPWHVALSPKWRCSYAPSWSTVLGLVDSQYSKRLSIGVFAAPRYQDAKPIRDTISDAVESTRSWAYANGYVCDVYEDELADRAAFEQLMSECDVVELFCHGYADPDDLEIALLVSSEGILPPLHVPGRTSFPDAHRLSWRDLQSLKRTPPLVLSAACSTGIQWQAGAGEQMGLFGAMRKGGTKALIGPRWDVVASDVLPLLSLLLEKHFGQHATLIDALHETCVEAEKHMPRWLAWSLALEGDWL